MSATAKIEITINWRIRRFLVRVLINFWCRSVRFDFTNRFKPDSVAFATKNRRLHLRQRAASLPSIRWKTSFQRVLLDARISELPHCGQVMIENAPVFELILPRVCPKFAGFPEPAGRRDEAEAGKRRAGQRKSRPLVLTRRWRDQASSREPYSTARR